MRLIAAFIKFNTGNLILLSLWLPQPPEVFFPQPQEPASSTLFLFWPYVYEETIFTVAHTLYF